MLIYVAGPYRADTHEGIAANIAKARYVAIKLWEAGHVAICPHLNTAHMEEDCKVKDETYLNGDLDILSRCDAIAMVEGWEKSTGATAEKEYAEKLGMPVYHQLPDLHPTERRCPVQVRRFREIQGMQYRMHLDKNADYSPMNVQGTGTIGVAVRTWDKVCRILNLLGFRMSAEFHGMASARDAQCEPLEDAWLDLSNYGIIGFMNAEKTWGK